MTAPGGPGAREPGGGEPGAPAAELIALLAARRQSIAVAESLTGGLLAAALTDVPGASAVFRGGVVAYATELKAVLLGVDRALLAAQGAVSAEVAGAMAEGAADRLGASVGAATTGVAGPDPAEGKPAGTVYVAASAGPQTLVRRLALSGSRAAIRAATVREALALVLVIVREET
jgi:nicotinamide-nucleotide amidase